MREIRYRAWNKQENHWATHNEQLSEVNVSASVRAPSIMTIGSDKYDLQVFTGLKDKNGVEIYEGDVVKADVGDGMLLSYKIIFEAGRFTMQDFGSECKSIWVLSDKCEVIGNIYEHTHLLD